MSTWLLHSEKKRQRDDKMKEVKHMDMRGTYIAVSKDAYLAHHGILGLKWGIRRYQNTDGSLTDAGKKRYGLNEKVNKVIAVGGKIAALNKKMSEPLGGPKKNPLSEKAADRYGILKKSEAQKRLEKLTTKNTEKEEAKRIRAERKKQLRLRRTLSDKELLEGIGRLEKEKKYKELLKEDLERGNKDVNDVLRQSGKKVATMALTGTALYVGQAWLKKNFDPLVAADYIFQKPSFKK